MYTKKEREQYNVRRDKICQALGITKNNYNWLRRKGEELHKVYEDNCNGYLEETEYSLKTAKLYIQIDKYLIKNGLQDLYSYYQTDPRGATIYIDNKPIPKNNYNQAYCIY